MAFVEYKSILFSRVGAPNDNEPDGTPDEPLVLLDSADEKGAIIVCSIIVCNFNNQPIRFNLRRTQGQEAGVPVIPGIPGIPGLPGGGDEMTSNATLVNLLVEPLETVDIIERFGFNFQMGDRQDQLLCFSNGHSEVFDCEITYQVFMDGADDGIPELPIPNPG